MARYVAFFSYTRFDDQLDGNKLTRLREQLELQLRGQLGRHDIQIFQDRDDIEVGDDWSARLQQALDEATYLIPVITPSFFASQYCREEFLHFWTRYKADPGSARIMPVYWLKDFQLDGDIPGADEDEVRAAVRAIQWDDWRRERLLEVGSSSTLERTVHLAHKLASHHVRQLHAPRPVAARPLPVAPPTLPKARDYTAEGRIKVDARFVHGAPEGWFLPGNGRNEWFQDMAGGPEMVVVPAGRFAMGASPQHIAELSKAHPELKEVFEWEGPQREVTIPEPFAIGRCAVTRGEFAAFLAANPGHAMPDRMRTYEQENGKWEAKERAGRSWRNPGFAQDDSHPVVGVSWDDATAYVQWLERTTGKPYCLLSEAQWEYAARAGTTAAFWWGDRISTSQANYHGEFGYLGSKADGVWRKATLPVDYTGESFGQNPWGLHHVHGNVWEWCADPWHYGYEDAPLDGRVWKQPGQAGVHVVRGGGWYNQPANLRASSRYGNGYRYSLLGFRVGRVPFSPRTL